MSNTKIVKAVVQRSSSYASGLQPIEVILEYSDGRNWKYTYRRPIWDPCDKLRQIERSSNGDYSGVWYCQAMLLAAQYAYSKGRVSNHHVVIACG